MDRLPVASDVRVGRLQIRVECRNVRLERGRQWKRPRARYGESSAHGARRRFFTGSDDDDDDDKCCARLGMPKWRASSARARTALPLVSTAASTATRSARTMGVGRTVPGYVTVTMASASTCSCRASAARHICRTFASLLPGAAPQIRLTSIAGTPGTRFPLSRAAGTSDAGNALVAVDSTPLTVYAVGPQPVTG